VQFCKREQIALYLVATPVHDAYRAEIPEAYRARFAELTDEYLTAGVEVIDRSALFPGDSLFANSDHLNAKGARRFTRLLRDEMQGVVDTSLAQ